MAATTWDPDGAGPTPAALVVGGDFLYAGGALVNCVALWDGSRWKPIGPAATPGVTTVGGSAVAVHALAVVNGKLVLAGRFNRAGTTVVNNIVQWDGTSWTPLGVGLGDPNSVVAALATSGASLFAGGSFTFSGCRGLARWESGSQTWNPLGVGVGGGAGAMVNALAIGGSGELYAGGDFSTAGGASARNVARWDGVQWSALGIGATNGVGARVFALAVYGGALYAGGAFSEAGGASANYIARWSGSAWSPLGTASVNGTSTWVRSLDVWSGSLVVGGDFPRVNALDPNTPANRVARWNGSQWFPIGQGVYDAEVYVVRSHAGRLIAAGSFTRALPDVATQRIAQWTDVSWRPLSEGFAVNTIPLPATIDAVAALADYGGQLYAGGYFDAVQGVAVQNIARWDGSAWHRLGNDYLTSGTLGAILAMHPLGTDLVVGGAFTTAGGINAFRVARWNGLNWGAMGPGLNKAVRCLTFAGGSFYAGGDFDSSGGSPVSRVARWDPNAGVWREVGSGITSPGASVRALAEFGGELYAGGDFQQSGQQSTAYIARFTSGAWASVNGGLNGVVHAMIAHDGALIVAGDFTTPATRIARWNGVNWSAIGAGFDGSVRSLAIYDGMLVAGGEFTSSGGVSVGRIATWDGAQWQPFGLGMDERVAVIRALGDTLHAGGRFLTAGEQSSAYFARWAPVGDAPVILTPPVGQSAPAGGTVVLAAGYEAGEGVTLQWFKGETPVVDGPRISGAQTATLSISPALPADAGSYSLVIVDACGAVETAAVTVQITFNDCNGNSIPDFCDFSCGFPCNEIAGCGQSTDCDGNGVPDECQVYPGEVEVGWIGGTGRWSVVGNWCPAIVPDNSAVRVFDVTVSGSGADAELDLSPTVRRLDIADGARVDARGAWPDPSLTVQNLLTLTGSELGAHAGRQLTLHAEAEADAASALRASGVGSQIILPAGTSVTGGALIAESGGLIDVNGGLGQNVTVVATAGGAIQLRNGGALIDATIGQLRIPAGSTGVLGGTTNNIGLIQVSGLTGLAALVPPAGATEFRFVGNGTLLLEESTSSPVARAILGAFGARLSNAADHTIRGTGRIEGYEIVNDGTLVAASLPPRSLQLLTTLVTNSGRVELEPDAGLTSLGDLDVPGGRVVLGDGSTLDVFGTVRLADGAEMGLASGGADATFVANALRLEPSEPTRAQTRLRMENAAQGVVVGDIDVTGDGPPCFVAGRGCTPPVLEMLGETSLIGLRDLRLGGGGRVAMVGDAHLGIGGDVAVSGGAVIALDENSSVDADFLRLAVPPGARATTGGEVNVGGGGHINVGGADIDGAGCVAERGCTPPVLRLTVSFGPALTIGGGGVTMSGDPDIVVDAGGTAIDLSGDWDNRSTAPAHFNWLRGALVLRGTSAFEVAGTDLGACPNGAAANFALATVRVEPGATITMRDLRDNDGQPQMPCGEALYLRRLEVGTNAVLVLDNVRVYYAELASSGLIQSLGCGAALPLNEADLDCDGAVTASDVEEWLDCMTRPGEPCAANCALADFDHDEDVDLTDYAVFQTLLTGR